ncbi:MAG: Asp-tRNA(Asn)/Glu-tRNA(Gln) amidotransferase subunit GatA [Crocinitomicaceae bacterium]|nr:Asp-tRNA(Asn)/Glu-tRNA(Gln) amidotransferase subunit GatA [Crocinitomicaceae bacterium]
MYRTIKEIKEALLSGATALSITQYYIAKIGENTHLNAFLEVFEESAIAQAIIVDEKIKKGTAGKLAGVVIGIKDNICYKNHKVSASSKILEGFESLYTATALQRLIDQDAIIIGRLNCDEFAMGSSNENSAFGSVENNWKANHVPGGSSGGSAVAVSANLCTVALGSDTGGSVRQPASWTGTYGLKPTYGRISRYGLIAYASSFDQIGCFTNCLEDATLLLEIMGGKDEMDATSSSKELERFSIQPASKGKVGILKECMAHAGLDAEVKASLDATIEKLKAQGHEIVELSFPYLDYLVPAYYVLTTAEASSNLSRFDGVHYGHRSTEAVGVEQTYIKSRTEGFGPEVKRRIMTGTFVLSHGYYDAYYTQAQKARRVLKDKTDEMFSKVDVLIMPTTPSTAFEKNAVKDTIQMYLQDIFTVHANLTGNPAISIPLAVHSNGLPYGIQLMTNRFDEKTLFDFAQTIEDLKE